MPTPNAIEVCRVDLFTEDAELQGMYFNGKKSLL